MLRAFVLGALALALAFGGAATAQQASSTTGSSGDATAGVGAPASEGTGVKGVYSTKRMMGISTGQTAGEEADASGTNEKSGEAKEDAASASE